MWTSCVTGILSLCLYLWPSDYIRVISECKGKLYYGIDMEEEQLGNHGKLNALYLHLVLPRVSSLINHVVNVFLTKIFLSVLCLGQIIKTQEGESCLHCF